MLRILDIGETALVTLIRLAIVLCLLALVVVVSYQVISRVSVAVPQWRATEELARGMFVWLVMLGACLGVRYGDHFALDLFAGRDAAFKARLRWLHLLVIATIAAIFVYHGWEFLQSGFRRRSLLTGLSSAWSYSSFFVAGCVMLTFLLRDFLGLLLGRPRSASGPVAGSP